MAVKVLPCFILVLFPVPVTCASCTTSQSGLYTWQPVNDKSVDIAGLPDKPWRSRSVMKCIVDCVNRVKNCNSILYFKQSQFCHPGYALSRPHTNFAMSVQVNVDEVIYSKTSKVCDGSSGYMLRYSHGMITCLQTFPNKLDYDTAERVCQHGGGGRLFVLEDSTRFNHIQGLSSSVYIGLQLRSEGYFWTDGRKFNSGTRSWSSLWAVGQPPRFPETCVVLGTDYRLYSENCNNPHQFICEILVV